MMVVSRGWGRRRPEVKEERSGDRPDRIVPLLQKALLDESDRAPRANSHLHLGELRDPVRVPERDRADREPRIGVTSRETEVMPGFLDVLGASEHRVRAERP